MPTTPPPTRIPVDRDQFENAVEMVSAGGFDGDAQAWVDARTGQLWVRFGAEEDEELPEDIDTATHYIDVPSRRDFDLGTPLAHAFVRRHLAAHEDQVHQIFSKRGAWRRFKDFLDRVGALDAWYAYEEAAFDEALSDWAAENNLELR